MVNDKLLALEQYLIGCMVHFPESRRTFFESLRNDKYFYHEDHRLIYQVCKRLWESDKGFNEITLAMAFRKDLGTDSKMLIYVVTQCTTKVNFDYFRPDVFQTNLEVAIDRYVRAEIDEKIIFAHNELTRQTDYTSDTGHEVASKLVKSITDIVNETTRLKPKDNKDVMREILADLENPEATYSKMCGIPSIDVLHGGLPTGGKLIVIGARPGMGKTAVALTMARFIANSAPVCYFSFEMLAKELFVRLLVAEVGDYEFTSHRIRTKEFDFKRLNENITNKMSILQSIPLKVIDKSGLDIEDVKIKIKEMAELHGVKFFVIDHIGLINVKGFRPDDLNGKTGQITSTLKALALNLDIDVIALSQLSRGVESRADKRPTLSDLRNSGNIEQDADAVIFLYREDYYKKNEPNFVETQILEIDFAKNRGGKTGNNVSQPDYIHLPTMRIGSSYFNEKSISYDKPQQFNPMPVAPDLKGFEARASSSILPPDLPF